MLSKIDKGSYRGQPAYTLESDLTKVVVLPLVSGKIASVVDKSSGRELLWQNPHRPYRRPAYGDRWAKYDMSGWEDCLPTVAASRYPEEPWHDTRLPEHGEIWALPWISRTDGREVELVVHGIHLPYRFEKRVSISDNRVRVHHCILNPSAFPIKYIWATHPLFAVHPGMRIVLPECTNVRIDWSRDYRLGGYLDELPWPKTQDSQGHPVQLDHVGEADVGHADKLYTSRVANGWCGLHDPEDGYAAALTFDPEQLPYVGIWINRGGYPLEDTPCYNVALEPTCGYPDLLDVAHSRGATATVNPGQQQEWTIELLFGSADSVESLLGDRSPER